MASLTDENLIVVQIREMIERRIVELSKDEQVFSDHNGDQEVIELLHKTQGEIRALSDLRRMIQHDLEKPISGISSFENVAVEPRL